MKRLGLLIVVLLLTGCAWLRGMPCTKSPYRSGVIRLEYFADRYAFDFSILDASCSCPFDCPTPSSAGDKDLIFSAHESFILEAPYGIVAADPSRMGCGIFELLDDDEALVEPVLNDLRANPIVVPERGYVTTLEVEWWNEFCQPYVLKTAEGHHALFYPVNFYIGAIDRHQIVWVYDQGDTGRFVVP